MPKPWEISKAGARNEAALLREQRERADRIAAPMLTSRLLADDDDTLPDELVDVLGDVPPQDNTILDPESDG
jgi:hypothetical protein